MQETRNREPKGALSLLIDLSSGYAMKHYRRLSKGTRALALICKQIKILSSVIRTDTHFKARYSRTIKFIRFAQSNFVSTTCHGDLN